MVPYHEGDARMKAVILAAGIGSRLHPFTADRPKVLVDVKGVPLLFRTLDRLAQVGITGSDIIVVSGYREDVLKARLADAGRGATVVFNPKFDTWNNFYSLYVAKDALGGQSFLQVDGDVLFDEKVLPRMLAFSGAAAMAIDVRPELDAETMKVEAEPSDNRIRAIAKTLDPRRSLGEYIGITKIDASASELLFAELAKLPGEGLTSEYYEHAYHRLAQRGTVPFYAVDVHDCRTTEIDDARDLERAESLV
jgi:choline kinase